MKFKLTLEANKSLNPIAYTDHLMLVGSCFTENMGAKLQRHLFSIHENPHGILFNPISVINALNDYIQCKQYTHSDLFEHNELFNSWHHHSRFSDSTSIKTLTKINLAISDAHAYLKKADKLIITLGSAWLYTLTDAAPHHAGMVVANNHKAPAAWFEKKLMDPAQLTIQLGELVKNLQAYNNDLQIIFTISPVRHLREGLVENNRSKAVLMYAVHELISKMQGLEYFPAYEFVVDDLRDYRFYAEDLVHPNYAATNYVWDKFVETYFNLETQALMKQVAELQLAMHHKPFNKSTQAHQSFIKNCLLKTQTLMDKYPFLPLQKALAFFNGEYINIV